MTKALRMLDGGRKFKKVLVLPDIHFPFADWDAINQAGAWARKHKPDLVVQLGDIMDQKAWSRFSKDADDHSPHDEWDLAAKDMNKLHRLFPKMQILLGNHDLRIMHKAMDAGLPRQVIRGLDDTFAFEGWKWHTSSREKLIINTDSGPTLFLHGDELGGNAIQISRRMGIN